MTKTVFYVIVVQVLFGTRLFCQHTTISPKNKNEREPATLHKALIIPFEPRLYMSEIDMSINAETRLSAKEIKYKFRDGLNEQLFKAFKQAGYNALDLMDDTAKYKKDLDGIYQHLNYDFQKVPNQENYKAPVKEKEQKKIEKGQINIESRDQDRFMNAKITNPKIVPILNGKYKTDIFVFVNQLDIKAVGYKAPGDLGDGNVNRKIIVHYTVYTLDAREINSGIAEEEFDPSVNTPKKIIDKHFSKIALTVVERVSKALVSPAR
ncbi:MAG: hypothetical protein V4635_17645 [Bacteroidota bacterium]